MKLLKITSDTFLGTGNSALQASPQVKHICLALEVVGVCCVSVGGEVWEATEEEQPATDVILHFPLLSPESPGHCPKNFS